MISRMLLYLWQSHSTFFLPWFLKAMISSTHMQSFPSFVWKSIHIYIWSQGTDQEKASQMESRGLRPLMAVVIWWWWLISPAVSDPQTNLLNQGCSTYNVTNLSDFYTNLNATFSDLETQLNNNKLFDTAERTRSGDSVYAMVQCRNYMSAEDCLACFADAQSLIRSCGAANGARVIYDGCFLRSLLF